MTTIFTHSRTRAGFALLALVQASLIFTITLIAVPLPLIGTEFGLGTSDLVLLQVAYGLPYSGLLLFGGRLTDRFGGSWLLVVGLGLFALSSAGAALAPEFKWLVTMRGLQGVAAAICAPAAVALVRALYPETDAFGRAMARWGGISVVGAATGTVMSGIVTTWISWRWMFAFPLCVSLIALSLMASLLPRAVTVRRPRYDLSGAVLALLGISLGSYSLVVGAEVGWRAPEVWGTALIGILFLTAFVLHEKRTKEPLLPPDFLRNRRRQIGVIGILLAAASMALATFILSLYLQRVLHWSPFTTAAAMVPYLLVLIFGGGPAVRLVQGFGAMRTNAAGLALATAGLVLLAGLGPNYLLQVLPGLLLLPAGTSLVFSASTVLLTENVAPQRMGLAGGVMNTAMELGPTAGLAAYMALAALRADVVGGYSFAFVGAAVSFALAACLCIAVRKGEHS
ncbi:MAG: MFS transporter [Loktanella sp.]|nr:MFS transporter [Loktanella sp.]